MTRVQPLFLTLLGAALIGLMPIAGEAQISVSLPSLEGEPSELVSIPISTDDLADLEVLAYSFTIAFDPAVVEITRVSAEGTLSDGMTVVANTRVPGEVTVAASSTTPLTGSGILLNLEGSYIGRGVTSLGWSSFLFNEGIPAVTTVAGEASVSIGSESGIPVSLPQTAGLVGETTTLSIPVGDLTGMEVFSYLFTIGYDPGVLQIREISAEGTVSAGMDIQTNTTIPGQFKVAASQTAPLEGSGTLLDLQVEYVGGGHSPLLWRDFYFNEYSPSPSATDGSVQVDGEILFNEIYSGPSPSVGWVELLVTGDHLDLRGYKVRDLGSGAQPGFTFADDPLWADLRRGTLILIGGNDAPFTDDIDPEDFVLSIRTGPFSPSPLLQGELFDLDSAGDALQILRPAGDHVFGVRWGDAVPEEFTDFQIDLGPDPLPSEASISFQGSALSGAIDAAGWAVVEQIQGTPGRANNQANEDWFVEQRGGALQVSDIDVHEAEVSLPALSGQVSRTTLAPVQVNDLTDLEVYAYLFTVEYDPEIVAITDVSTDGTLSADMNVEVNAATPGRTIVAAYHTAPLQGSGALIDLQVEYVGPGETELTWAEFTFNEGIPPAITTDGSAVARVGAVAGIDLSLPATTGQIGDVVSWPVQIGDLIGNNVFSYLLAIEYDPAILSVTGISTDGAISAGMFFESNISVPGQIIVAASTDTPLEGAGLLFTIEGEHIGRGTSDLRWTNFAFNEGDVEGSTVDGRVTVENAPLTAVPDALDVPEDTPHTLSVLANDTDPDGDPLTIAAIVVDPLHGTVVIDPDSTSLTYTSELDYNGPDELEYVVTDGLGDVDTTTVSLTVTPVNDPPVGIDNETVALKGTLLTIFALANDLDVDGDQLTISSVTAPAHGSAVVSPDGLSIAYTPEAGFFGPDQFAYTLSDGNGGTTTAEISIEVVKFNDPPVPVDDSAETDEDIPITIEPLANDTDPDGDPFTVTAVTAPSSGTVAIDSGDTTVTYTPEADFFGEDSFEYSVTDSNGETSIGTVSLTILSVNDPPVPADNAATTEEDSPVAIDVLIDDADVDGGTLTVTETTDPAAGSVVIDADGTAVTYTPSADFHGEDSFTYTVDDGQGGTATATVTITVTPVNDPPVAADDPATAGEETPVAILVLTNDADVDGDDLTVTEITAPASGTVAIDPGDTTITYTPNPNFNGQDSFTYTVDDGQGGNATATVTITVTSVNDPPIASDDPVTTGEDIPIVVEPLTNDVDVDGDDLTVAETSTPSSGTVVIDPGDTTITYTPNLDFHGEDSFTYTVDDGQGGNATAVVTITVEPANDPPVAADDPANTGEDTPVVVEPLTNDTDVDGDGLTIAEITAPTSGTVVIDPGDTTITYTPNPNFNGQDTITYTIADPTGQTATATVNVTITPVNDPPVALADAAETDQDVAVAIPVLDNDSDIDGDQLTLDSVGQPQNGTAIIADGTIEYTPQTGFSGEDTFTYTVVDPDEASASAAVTITVHPEQIPPTLVDSNPVDEDIGLEVDPLNAGGMVFVFDEPIASDGVQVSVQADGQTLAWLPIWSADRTQLTLRPAAENRLLPGTAYQVLINGVLDLKGNDAGTIDIAFETEAALPGDVNADAVVDVRDVILTLRLAAGLPVATPPAGHTEPTPYELRTADVSEDGSIDEADALLTLGTALGRIATKPLVAQSGSAVLRWGLPVYEGADLTVAVRVEGRTDPHAGRIRLRYDSAALDLLEVTAASGDALMAINDRTDGELGVSLIDIDGLVAAGGEILYLRFHLDPALREQIGIEMDGARLFDGSAGRMEIQSGGQTLRLLPTSYALHQNAPNPFNPSTQIRYQLPRAENVRLVIYDLLGRTVRVLADDHQEAGYHLVTWDGRDQIGRPVGSGIYLMRLMAGNFAQVRKMTLMR